MNGFPSRGWGHTAKRANNRGRSNGSGMHGGQELSPYNSRNGNGNGHGRGLLEVGFHPFGRPTEAGEHMVEEESKTMAISCP